MTARVIPFGDRALLVEVDDVAAAHLLAAAVDRARARGRAPRSVTEVVVGMGNVVIHLDERTDGDDVHRWVESIATRPPPTPPGAGPARGPVHLPVVFDGPDLEEVAGLTGHTGDQVVALLTGARLTVAFLGFAPGFPYLTGLPPVLAAVPRRSTPRTAVPAGSVAVGGGFASVYPRSTPGGWRLLGRTATPMFDPDHPPFALLRPGDDHKGFAGVVGRLFERLRVEIAAHDAIILEDYAKGLIDQELVTLVITEAKRRGKIERR